MSSLDPRLAPTATALLAGSLFGAGLAIAGMTNPAKVLNFLDVAGDWDPSLLLVMASAVAITFASVKLILRRRTPLFEASFDLPTRKDVDLPLVAGSAIFGVGWGLAGYCPGPALASLASLSIDAVLFVVAMAVGMILHRGSRSRAAANGRGLT
jgi:uncharacterized membrane protein YedE/YeeE